MKRKKFLVTTVVCILVVACLTGCEWSWLDSKINDIKGELVGNSFTIESYDHYGQKKQTRQRRKAA